MRKIMIDTGMTRRVNCRGVEPDTVELIGSALSRELDARGCETMTSCGVPDPDEGFGRPSRCADVARRWGAVPVQNRLCNGASRQQCGVPVSP